MQINLKYVVIAMGAVILLLILYIMFLHMKLLLSQSKTSAQPIVINNYTGSATSNQPAPTENNFQSKITSMPQSSFFMDSINFAEKFVKGQVNYDGNIPLTQSAMKTLSALSVLNDQIKNNIVTAINYNVVDTANAMNNENRLRSIALAEKTPLWIVIIKEAMGKAAPSISASGQFNPNAVTDNTTQPSAGPFSKLLSN